MRRDGKVSGLRRRFPLSKLDPRLCLLGTHSARDNFCLMVILASHRAAGHAAKHGDLADVRKGFGNGTLETDLPRYKRAATRTKAAGRKLRAPHRSASFPAPR